MNVTYLHQGWSDSETPLPIYHNLKWLTSGSNSVKSESAFAGTLIVFNAWNSASFIKLLTRLSSDIGTL